MFYRSSLNGIVSLKKKSLNGIAAVHMPLRYNAPIVEQLPSMAVVSLSEAPDGNGAPKSANPTGTPFKWRGFGKKLDPPGLMGRVWGWQTRTRRPANSL
jgi:hypothetical protein